MRIQIKVSEHKIKLDMKISDLCKMIEDTIHSGRYPFEDKQQKHFANSVKIINRSDSEDLKTKDIKIEVRIQDLYTINNYSPSIQHLPGVIEIDALDSFKMLCRRLGRLDTGNNDDKTKNIIIDKLKSDF